VEKETGKERRKCEKKQVRGIAKLEKMDGEERRQGRVRNTLGRIPPTTTFGTK